MKSRGSAADSGVGGFSPPPVSDDGQTPWTLVVLFAAAGFFTMTTSLMTAGLLPAMARDFGVSEGVTGSLTSVFAMAVVITVLPGTRWALRFSRRAIIVSTVLALVASNLVVASAPTLVVALIGRFLGGTAHGLLVSAMPAVIARIVPVRNAPRAMGIALAGNSAGLAVGAPLTAVLSGGLGWRGAFVAAAGFGLLVALALWKTVPSLYVRRSESGSIWQTAKTPGVVRMSVSWATILLGHYAVLTFVAPIFMNLGGTEETVGLPLLILGGMGMIGVLLAGGIGTTRIFWAAVMTSTLVAAAFVVISIQPPLPLVYAMLGVWGAGSAASLLLNQQCVLVAGHRSPELSMSLGLLITQFGVALGSAVGGVSLQTMGAGSVPLVGAAAIVIALLMVIGMPRVLRRAQEERAPSGR